MPWGVAAAAVSAYGAMEASGNAADAQNRATDAATASASAADKLNRDKFEWDKQTYTNDVLPAQRQAQALQSKIGEESLAASQQQRQFAADQQQYYKDTFQPLEKKVADEAQNYDSQENVDRRSGIASANVNQQFSNARGQSARLAGRYGLGSTAMSGPAGASERAQALGTAGAATGAAFDTMDKGIALRAGAANFGRNMPNTAATFSGIGNQSGAVASGAGSAGLNSALTGSSFMNNAYQQNIGNTLGIGNSLSNAYQTSANAWGNAAAGLGKFAGGLYGSSSGGNPFSGAINTVKGWFGGNSNTYGMDADTAALVGL
jgi:hypothetical protein